MALTVSQILERSNALYSIQAPVCSLWQTMAEHFYPERADFTRRHNVGEEFGNRLMDSYPVIARRDLADSFQSMLRDGDDWFTVDVDMRGSAKPDWDSRSWLEDATMSLRRLLASRLSGTMRALKEGDHDFATFGQCVISVEAQEDRRGLRLRCWHLRDMAWADGLNGEVEQVHRKWKPHAHHIPTIFKNIHTSMKEVADKTPMKEVNIRHVVMPSHLYGDSRFERFPYVSLYVDVDNLHLMEATGLKHQFYVLPRAQTIAGSPYAYSPATCAALPSSRTLQAMTFTLLEAGERVARPPMVATAGVIRGDVNLDPDGVTYVDKDYDERNGGSLRPLYGDKGGLSYGLNMRDGIVGMVASAFRLDKLKLPDAGQMTAYEVSERMKQFRRENLPLFAPLETEYNGQVIDACFSVALQHGMLGAPMDIPRGLQGADVKFEFASPLKDLEGERRVVEFQRVNEMLRMGAEIDQTLIADVDVRTAFRETVEAIDAPTSWLRDLKEVQQRAEMMQAQAAQQEAQAA